MGRDCFRENGPPCEGRHSEISRKIGKDWQRPWQDQQKCACFACWFLCNKGWVCHSHW